MNKPVIKSKTMQGIAVIAIIALMNLLGVGEEQIGDTYDTIVNVNGPQHETTKDIGLLVGAGLAYYGRLNV